MIRIVYKDKLEMIAEVNDTAITYYAPDYICKDIDYDGAVEDISESIAEMVESRPQDRDKMILFLTSMKISYTDSETDVQLTDKINLFLSESNYSPEWDEGVSLIAGEVIEFQGLWYRVIQSHITQKFWQPNIVPSLFVITSPPTEIPVWIQPTGVHDAYNIGDKVHFPTINDPVYQSNINANVWSPIVYAAGWTSI